MNELDTSENTNHESEQYLKVLPKSLYEKVCETLDLPVLNSVGEDKEKTKATFQRRHIKQPLLSTRKTLFIDREMQSDTEVEYDMSHQEQTINVHWELLQKSEREMFTWESHYLEPEREDQKSLVKKADDLTDKISQEFCHFMKQLGSEESSELFTPEAIKELFQIEFDTHVAHSLKVVTNVLPTVGDKVAKATHQPEKSFKKTLENEITKDLQAELKPDHIKAFNKSLPKREQWRAPKNETEKLWRSARHVPRDLVTFKTVWEGITNLRSVIEFCRWMIDNPEYRRAPFLDSLGMFDPPVLEAKARMKFDQGSSKCISSYKSKI